jgi:hypothetical protein
MTTTIDLNQTYLQAGEINALNMHLFAPDMREAYLFLQQYEDKPINPIKHAEAVMTSFWWKWSPQIEELKITNSNLPFKDLISKLLLQIPADLDADIVMDLIAKTKKSWYK